MKRAHQYIVFLLIGVSIALVGALILPDPLHLRWSRWAYSDWLISYDAGFVRRGLAGGLIRLVQGGIGDLVVVNLLVFANYTVLCLLLLWVWLKSTARSPLAFVLAILIPGGLFQMAAWQRVFFPQGDPLPCRTGNRLRAAMASSCPQTLSRAGCVSHGFSSVCF